MRRFRRLLPCLLPLFSFAGTAGAVENNVAKVQRFQSYTMGTTVHVSVVEADTLEAARLAQVGGNTFAFVDSLMSNWTTTSEVARINREAGSKTIPIHPEVSRVLEFATEVHESSGGAFDVTVEPLVRLWGFLDGKPRVPEATAIEETLARIGTQHLQHDPEAGTLGFGLPDLRLDLGGIAKGYGVDRAWEAMEQEGAKGVLLNLSGNILLRGSPPDRERWSVGIRDPRDRWPTIGTLELTDCALATSGAYEQFVDQGGRRYGHILDPKTGWPSETLHAVTVVTQSAMEADAWGTALFVLGAEEAKRIAKRETVVHAILIEPQGDKYILWIEESISKSFVIRPEIAEHFELRTF